MDRESRRLPRRAVDGLIDVVDTMTEEAVGHPSNLSVGGMLLIASKRLVEDALYQFRFVLPDVDGHPIEVGAHVLWCDDVSAPGHAWVGVRFLGLAPDATRRLRGWIDQGHDAR